MEEIKINISRNIIKDIGNNINVKPWLIIRAGTMLKIDIAIGINIWRNITDSIIELIKENLNG